MIPTIIFPSSYFEPKKVDEMFVDQAEACDELGIQYEILNIDNLNSIKLTESLIGKYVLYRGWMLSENEYSALYDNLKHAGVFMLVDTTNYIQSHYLPYWYPQIASLTPQTKVFPFDENLISNIEALNWEQYFIKDFVKSLSTSQSPIVQSQQQLIELLENMQKYRGKIEGGICVRKLEDFSFDDEQRYFVINGVAYSPRGAVPEIVNKCVRQLNQLFYCVDICKNSVGDYRVIEVGDGQVSDLKEWSNYEFYNMIKQASWF